MLVIDGFIKVMTETAGRLLKMKDDEFFREGAGAILQAAKFADGFVFTEATMTMLIEKLAHFDETIREVTTMADIDIARLNEAISPRGFWLQFSKPIDDVAALLHFTPAFYLSTGKDYPALVLIRADYGVVDVMEWVPGHGYLYNLAMHQCPDCSYHNKQLVWCKPHAARLDAWSKILAISIIIAMQYLAERRYEEKTATTMLRVPREKSHKERRVPLKHVYRVIDATELIIPVRVEDSTAHEKRGSWIDDTTVYEEIRTRRFTRTYRHPRYVNVKGQTIDFPNGIKRLQPRKVERLGKVVTKVTAAKFEEEGDHNDR